MAFSFYGKKFGPTDQESLLEPDFAPHLEAWKKTPTPETAGALLRVIDPVIQSAMRTYAGQTAASPTIRSKAKLIALDSLQRYDPAKAKLRTHLMTNLQGLHRVAAQEGQAIDVPERVRMDNFRVREANTELEDMLGRAPSDAELAERAGMSLKRLTHIRKAKPTLAEGSLETMPNEMGESELSAPAVVQNDTNDAWSRFIYADLQPTDQFIMEHTLGMHGKPILPKGVIAKKLGLSAGAISQRAARVQKLLDQKYELRTGLFE